MVEEATNAASQTSVKIKFGGTYQTSLLSKYVCSLTGGDGDEWTSGTCAPWYDGNDFVNSSENYVKMGGQFTIRYIVNGVSKSERYTLSAGKTVSIHCDTNTEITLSEITVNDGFYAGVYKFEHWSASESDWWQDDYEWEQLSTESDNVTNNVGNYGLDIDIVSRSIGCYQFEVITLYEGEPLLSSATFRLFIDGKEIGLFSNYYAEIKRGSFYKIEIYKSDTPTDYFGGNEGSLEGYITESKKIVLKFYYKTWIYYAATGYAGGIGTETNPYIIKTAEQLAKLAKDSRLSNLSGKYYKLAGNIDLSEQIWPGIGNSATKFAGNFNGDMYTISDMKTSTNYYMPKEAGLFGYVESPAIIQNLIMKGGLVTGQHDSGVIVGGNDTASIIKNCIVDGAKLMNIPNNQSAGGIAGRFTGGTIISCVYMNGTIRSVGTAAGICGWRGTIVDCAVINCILSTEWGVENNRDISVGWSDNATIVSSYAIAKCNNISKKMMYGNSNTWSNWSYNPSLNGGYPVQKTLFHIGGITGSQNVYNYLTDNLKFTVR